MPAFESPAERPPNFARRLVPLAAVAALAVIAYCLFGRDALSLEGADELGADDLDALENARGRALGLLVERQVEVIDEQMRARTIVPGSQTALRLFADESDY